MQLVGKVALVTGGARGIGRAYVEALAQNGVKIAVCDILDDEGEDLVRRLNTDKFCCIYTHCDVTNEKTLEECFKKTISEFGRIDIVVNNAGIIDDRRNWRKEVDINLCGVVQGSLLGLRYMRRGGSIVVTTSLAGILGDSLFPIYAATKAAANYFVKSLGASKPFKHTGIRILGIAPGFTDTSMVESSFADSSLIPELSDFVIERQTTLNRQRPESAAACLIHILKEDAPSGSIWLVNNDHWRIVNYEI